MNTDYLKFLVSVEEALYDPRDLERDVHADEPEEVNGLVYTYYFGAESKPYSLPMFSIKKDHLEEGMYCHRCKGCAWTMADDQVSQARYLTVFEENGIRGVKEVHFNRVFAARRSHP